MKSALCTFGTRLAQRRIERILAILGICPAPCVELAKEMHLSPKTVWRYLDHMMNLSPRKVRITDWQGSTRSAPIYALGSEPDAPRAALYAQQ